MSETAAALVRIGELSRRTGVTPELLRMWERRYGLVDPRRTEGGFRLYSPADEERVRRMQKGIADGLPASLAAQLIGTGPERGDQVALGGSPAEIVRELTIALDRFDEAAANAALDRTLAVFALRTTLDAIVLPYLQDLGARWEHGKISIAQEHFATSILRGRLLGLARGWGTGAGPRALLACPPGELHDLGLICFGLMLREHGWRIVLLGPNTPIATIREAADALAPQIVVISAMAADALSVVLPALTELGAHHRLALAGPGATPDLAGTTRALVLTESPTEAANRIADLG